MAANDSTDLKLGLPPVVGPETRVLILGSLPSDESIRRQEYYANPNNHFWSIMYSVFDSGEPASDYKARLAFLRSAGVGLWDVLHSANRAGSADSAIRDAVANDVLALLAAHPEIRLVLLNGGKARDCFRQYFGHAQVAARYVPSSSPTPGRNVLPVGQRVERWREAIGDPEAL